MDGGDGAVAALTVKTHRREGIPFLNEKKVGICYREVEGERLQDTAFA